MAEQLLKALIPFVLSMLTKEQLRKFADMALDFVEDAVVDSTNKIDDAIALPIIERLRDTFNIPDND
jgi:hypothetical protein